MSTTIDQRVVEMQFDNQQFERNVSTTMSTLDKLKQGLRLDGATKGLEGVNTAARGVSFAGLGSGIDAIQAKFSALQVMGITALSNITNTAVNAGKRIASALTIDPVKTGFSEYETQINAVQTILANTKSKGTTIDDVNGALDELNKYADKTIYNFTEMTRNIGTFTAAGVDLDKSVTSIKGIANLAAVSGSTSQQASTAMYQLSQALAAGKVQLMDWNSVVNAGMGGEVFQEALKRTARNMGTNVDAMIEKYGSFRESLTQGEWLTAEVLTETLTQLSGAYSEADLIAQGYTEKQAKEIVELANTAEGAATDVKTFTQLWDTLKEAAQSGWTQTWELIVGDFEEAKSLLSDISRVLNGVIGESAESRNAILTEWKDLGGRTALIEGLKGAFEALVSVVTPIKEAFKNIFPDSAEEKGKKLYDLTMDIAVFLKKLKLSDTASENLRKTFEGIFAVVDIGIEAFKALAGGVGDLLGIFDGAGEGILGITASIGECLVSLRDSIKDGNSFGDVVEKITGIISSAIEKFKEFGQSVKDIFQGKDYQGFVGVLEYIWDLIKKIGSVIGNVFSSLGNGIANAMGEASIGDAAGSGLLAGLLFGMVKLVKGLSSPLEAFEGFADNIKGVLDDVRESIQSYQDSLQAETLKKIAVAIGILAASILVLSMIDAGSLAAALGAITILFTELFAALSVFSTITTSGFGSTAKIISLMTGISVAIFILAGALTLTSKAVDILADACASLSSLSVEEIMRGLAGIGGLLVELSRFLKTADFNGGITSAALGILILSAAMVVMAKAVEDFGSMNWGEIGKGLAGIGGLLLELGIFTKLASGSTNMVSVGIGMVALGGAMKIFASATKDFSGMNWDEMGRGLLGMGGALAAICVALNMMPNNTLVIGAGLVVVGAALKIVASAFSDIASIEGDQITRSFMAITGVLGMLVIALTQMTGTLAGSAALLVAAGALAILAPTMERLGQISFGELMTGLVVMAAAFSAIGVAGMLLAPTVPILLGLSGALALFGISTVAIGVGLTAIATGLSALATASAVNATAIVASLTVIIAGVADLIPMLIGKLGEGIVALCVAIGSSAGAIGEAFAKIVEVIVIDVLGVITKNTYAIVDSLITIVMACLSAINEHISDFIQLGVDIIIGLIDGITQSIPKVIQAGVDLILGFINGVADALRDNTPALMSALSNLFSACIEAAVAVVFGGVGMFVDGGIALVNGIIKGVTGLYSKIRTAFTDLVNSAKTATNGKVSEFISIGSSMVDGLVSGVKNAASKLVKAAKGVVNSAIEAAKKLLKINSPSKVFMSFGESMDEGLIVGLNNMKSQVVSATKDVGRGAIKGMANIASTVANAIDTDIDVQPTIRPVLDLSEVSSGANNINRMFGMRPSVGVLANVGTVSAMMNRQNGANDDVVSAIKDLGRSFKGKTGDTYSINGITYSDGTEVSDAVKVLVRATKMEGRRR